MLLIVSCKNASAPSTTNLAGKDSLLLIGWDGCNRPEILKLLQEKKLPNLQALIDEGSFVVTEVDEDETETKPQWSQILTGYNSSVHGVFSNLNYGPIPKGLTVFERLYEKFGKDISFAFISGKINNVSFRGPHDICMNCLFRLPDKNNKKLPWGFVNEKTNLEFAQDNAPTRRGQKRIIQKRAGQPYYNLYQTGIVKYMVNSLNAGDNVLNYFNNIVDEITKNRFFTFLHFEEPDEQGHQFGEGSEEYYNAILKNDQRLGVILEKLKQLGRYNRIAVIVVTDHGFDIGKKSHMDAHQTFLVSNLKNLKKQSVPKNVTPTILDFFGVDTSRYTIKLKGQSLINR